MSSVSSFFSKLHIAWINTERRINGGFVLLFLRMIGQIHWWANEGMYYSLNLRTIPNL